MYLKALPACLTLKCQTLVYEYIYKKYKIIIYILFLENNKWMLLKLKFTILSKTKVRMAKKYFCKLNNPHLKLQKKNIFSFWKFVTINLMAIIILMRVCLAKH